MSSCIVTPRATSPAFSAAPGGATKAAEASRAEELHGAVHIVTDRLRRPLRRQRMQPAERPVQPLNFLRVGDEPVGEERQLSRQPAVDELDTQDAVGSTVDARTTPPGKATGHREGLISDHPRPGNNRKSPSQGDVASRCPGRIGTSDTTQVDCEAVEDGTEGRRSRGCRVPFELRHHAMQMCRSNTRFGRGGTRPCSRPPGNGGSYPPGTNPCSRTALKRTNCHIRATTNAEAR
jgi:hypothetical protein